MKYRLKPLILALAAAYLAGTSLLYLAGVLSSFAAVWCAAPVLGGAALLVFLFPVSLRRARLVLDGDPYSVVDRFSLLDRKYIRTRDLVSHRYPGVETSIPFRKGAKDLVFLLPFQKVADIFFPRPGDLGNALVLGVAGAALPRYLLNRYPEARVTGVELSQDMIETGRRYFFFDLPLERFDLHCGSGADFLRDFPSEHHYDVIFCDMYLGKGICKCYDDAFFRDARRILKPDAGLILINLQIISSTTLQPIITAAQAHFEYVLCLSERGRIFLAVTGPAGHALLRQSFGRLQRQAVATLLEFPFPGN